jgi:hypothetical protein
MRIRIFVSSPSDVESERNQLTKVVSDLNATITSVAIEKGISLELLKWETHTTPALNPGGAQGVVTQQIGTYDLLIGIMWKRFGTPTPRCGSGTEEEFRVAYESWNRTRTPEIMFYFCQAPFPLPRDQEELNQLQKVAAFRNELSQKGLLGEYEDRDSFADVARAHLNLVLGRIFSTASAQREAMQRISSTAMEKDSAVERKLMALALEYVHIRKYVAWTSDGKRDRKLEAITTRMKALAFAAYPLLPKLIESVPENEGEDERAGERLAAVAMLEALPNPEFLDWLARRLADEQPFIAYHAALAFLFATRTLERLHHQKLADAISKAKTAAANREFVETARRILDDAENELLT